MDNITEFEVTDALSGETLTYITITTESGFTTMLKADWQAAQEAQSL